MKVICLVSHKQPESEPGKFKLFEHGREYELDEFDPSLFRAVNPSTDMGNEPAVKAGKSKKSAEV